MNTYFLKTFITLAENGSFSKTAKELFAAQSTISKRISELERELGQKLFVRSRSYAELTLAGKALLEYAGQIIDLEDKAVEQVSLSGVFSDRLVLGSAYAFYDLYLYENIENFMQRYPDISLKLVFAHTMEIIASLRQGSIDIGYTHHPLNHPGFNCAMISEDEVILVTGGQNREYINGVPSCQINNLPVLYSNFLYTPTYTWLFPGHRQFPLDIDICHKVIPFLKRGSRYTFLPKRLVEKEIAEGSILEIPLLDGSIPPVQNYLIHKQEHPKSETIRKWIEVFDPAVTGL
ncbi:MAG: LysR family transcriptional regulator [Treponema sp.]|jgi:LysR family transcriptional repressor of citA|nr:LysR family transcriptional regulator [Treponema sp.]